MPRSPLTRATRGERAADPMALVAELKQEVQKLPGEALFILFEDALRMADGDRFDRFVEMLRASSLPVKEALSAVADDADADVLGYLAGCSFPAFPGGPLLDADKVDALLEDAGIAPDHALHPTRMRREREDDPPHFKTPPRSVFMEAARTLESKKERREYREEDASITFVRELRIRPLPGGDYQVTRHFVITVEDEHNLNERLRQALKLGRGITQDKPEPLGVWRFTEVKEGEGRNAAVVVGPDGYPLVKVEPILLWDGKSSAFGNGKEEFEALTEELLDQYRKLRAAYTQEDLRQAWMRWSDAAESFMFNFGFGGIRFVPKKYAKELRAWYRLMEHAYGAGTSNMRWMGVRNTEKMRASLKEDAERAVQRKNDQLLEDIDRRFRALLPKLAKGEKGEREFERGLERLKMDVEKAGDFVERLAEKFTDIIGGSIDNATRVEVPKPSYTMSVQAAAQSDPRVSAFLKDVHKKLGGPGARAGRAPALSPTHKAARAKTAKGA